MHGSFCVCYLQAYKKEYGKQVEGNVEVKSLTGAPFTIANRVGAAMIRIFHWYDIKNLMLVQLGGEAALFVQPGPNLKVYLHVK